MLWRRLDAAFADPLELRYDSRIGTPGLVEALRHGSISMVNALGSGILETRALLAFLPRLSQALLGEALELPTIATWWCGQATERQHVLDNFDRMMIGPAFSTTPALRGSTSAPCSARRSTPSRTRRADRAPARATAPTLSARSR